MHYPAPWIGQDDPAQYHFERQRHEHPHSADFPCLLGRLDAPERRQPPKISCEQDEQNDSRNLMRREIAELRFVQQIARAAIENRHQHHAEPGEKIFKEQAVICRSEASADGSRHLPVAGSTGLQAYSLFVAIQLNLLTQGIDGGSMVAGMQNAMAAARDPLLDIFRHVVNQNPMRSAEFLLALFRHDVHGEFRPENAADPLAFLLLKNMGCGRAGQENRFQLFGRFPKHQTAFDQFQFCKKALVRIDHFPELRAIELTGMLAAQMFYALIEVGEYTVQIQKHLQFRP